MSPLFIVLLLPVLWTVVDFLKYLTTGKRLYGPRASRVLATLVVVILPVLYLSFFDVNLKNDCCSDTATFSPEHRLTIYCWILLCAAAFFYSLYRDAPAPPLLEVVVNGLLLIGIVLNGFIGYQAEAYLWALGNLPIMLLFVVALMENQKMILVQTDQLSIEPAGRWSAWAWKVLTLPAWYKYPVLMVLCLPIVVVVTTVLLLFGQKPDSAIRAFTDTYKHGFSQLDYLCANVECGGHYLCSVAANGHPAIVKPQRYGIRGGRLIRCNRQLLVSNAFEDLIQKNWPRAHRVIRRHYDTVGDIIHQNRDFYQNKYVADAVYLLMKPLEYAFLLVLYTCDRKPENRIARQYLGTVPGMEG